MLRDDADAEIETDEFDDDRYQRYELYGTMSTKVVGIRYYNGTATVGEFCTVRREPSNPVCLFLFTFVFFYKELLSSFFSMLFLLKGHGISREISTRVTRALLAFISIRKAVHCRSTFDALDILFFNTYAKSCSMIATPSG